jgi:hypothetical protein
MVSMESAERPSGRTNAEGGCGVDCEGVDAIAGFSRLCQSLCRLWRYGSLACDLIEVGDWTARAAKGEVRG